MVELGPITIYLISNLSSFGIYNDDDLQSLKWNFSIESNGKKWYKFVDISFKFVKLFLGLLVEVFLSLQNLIVNCIDVFLIVIIHDFVNYLIL